jgi:L-asparaginase
MNHVNAKQQHVDALVNAGVQGLVIAGTGNGSVSSKMKESLVRAQIAGVQIRLSSRCNQGAVIPTSNHAFDAKGALSPAKTRVALLLEIMSERQSH